MSLFAARLNCRSFHYSSIRLASRRVCTKLRRRTRVADDAGSVVSLERESERACGLVFASYKFSLRAGLFASFGALNTREGNAKSENEVINEQLGDCARRLFNECSRFLAAAAAAAATASVGGSSGRCTAHVFFALPFDRRPLAEPLIIIDRTPSCRDAWRGSWGPLVLFGRTTRRSGP